MRYYITPFCDIYDNREEAAGDISDLFFRTVEGTDTDTDARRAFCASCEEAAGDDLEMFGFLIDDDGELAQWADYKAYDLLDDAERAGSATLYGVTVYADEKAEALTQRAVDEFDPWCGSDVRVALFCAIYNGGEELEWLLEQLHDLTHEVDPDEAEKILALVEDISRFDGERRPA